MSLEQIEARVSAIERELAEVKRCGVAPSPAMPGKAGLLAAVGAFAGDRGFVDAMAYAAYLRKTGSPPPTGWRPGDPIPTAGGGT